MTLAIVIPYRAECPHRARALAWTVAEYQRTFPGVPIHVADDGGDDGNGWSKGHAVSAALRLTSPDADVIIVADADSWCDAITGAVRAVEAFEYNWATPHHSVSRLSLQATTEVLGGVHPHAGLELIEGHRPYAAVLGGGITVIRREMLEATPIDPRFRDWGGEDVSWAIALSARHGKPWQGTVPLYHLWHPPYQRAGYRFRQNGNLVRLYQRAVRRNDLDAMVAEAQHA